MEKDKPVINIMLDIKKDKGISLNDIEKIIESPFDFSRKTLSKLDFKSMSIEEFRKANKNFNYPGLGKLYAKEEIFYNINNKKKNNE